MSGFWTKQDMGLDALLLENGCWKTYSLVVIGMVVVTQINVWKVVVARGKYFAPNSVHKSKASARCIKYS
eukprot:5336643-Heterocapsa_arctica.AAC.1